MTDSPGTQTRRKRPSKQIIMFGLSLLLGAAGVFYSKQYIETQIAYYKGQFEKTEPMVSLVVPNRPLARGHVLLAEDLSIREIPVKYADSNSVTGQNYEIAIGQRIDFDVDEGRPLLWAHLEGGITPTFSGKVEEGLRAMTVRVDEINSISGFLQPQDKVDLLLTYGAGEKQIIFPVIQKLNVIATGVQTLVDKASNGRTRNFTTMTVHVTPDQAQKITLAQSVGKLTAMLRNPDDESPLSDVPMNIAKLLNIPEPAPVVKKKQKKIKAKPEPGIEYIVGGGR